jgi:hypothetical protein
MPDTIWIMEKMMRIIRGKKYEKKRTPGVNAVEHNLSRGGGSTRHLVCRWTSVSAF